MRSRMRVGMSELKLGKCPYQTYLFRSFPQKTRSRSRQILSGMQRCAGPEYFWELKKEARRKFKPQCKSNKSGVSLCFTKVRVDRRRGTIPAGLLDDVEDSMRPRVKDPHAKERGIERSFGGEAA